MMSFLRPVALMRTVQKPLETPQATLPSPASEKRASGPEIDPAEPPEPYASKGMHVDRSCEVLIVHCIDDAQALDASSELSRQDGVQFGK
jgi:hypothetical protein